METDGHPWTFVYSRGGAHGDLWRFMGIDEDLKDVHGDLNSEK